MTLRTLNFELRTARWLLIAVMVLCATASAEVPHLIRYQGQVADSQGVPLEGPYSLTFRLYDAETAGTKLWEERQPNIPLTGGHFSVLLGQVTPLLDVDWSRPRWLSFQVGAEPELAPRQPITSVPLALRAERAEQLTVPITTSTITDDTHNLVPQGAVIIWLGGACPSGYSRVSALDGRFLVVSSSYNPAAGGSNTIDTSHMHGAGSYAGPNHTHSISHEHAVSGYIQPAPYGGAEVSNGEGGGGFTHNQQSTSSGSGGTGAVTGTSAAGGSSVDIRPAFATVLLCQKN